MTSHSIPTTMQAVMLHRTDGSPDAITLEQRAVPQPGPDQVLIRMHAAPINPSDLMFLRGLYGISKTLPVVPGFEGSGTVVAAGGGLWARALVGRTVACAAPDNGDGTWAEYMVTSVNRCVPLFGISPAQGAMLLVNPLTAWALVDIAQRDRHQAVVQTAAASTLGRMILRLGQRRGLTIIHVVRRQEQATLLHSLGAQHVLDSSAADFDAQLRDLCHELNATLAFDAVAGELTGRVLHAMPRGARITVYGGLSEQACQINPLDPIFAGKQLDGFWLSEWLDRQSFSDIGRLALAVQRLVDGDFRSEVRACLPLRQIHRALDLYAPRMTEGKVLLVPGL